MAKTSLWEEVDEDGVVTSLLGDPGAVEENLMRFSPGDPATLEGNLMRFTAGDVGIEMAPFLGSDFTPTDSMSSGGIESLPIGCGLSLQNAPDVHRLGLVSHNDNTGSNKP